MAASPPAGNATTGSTVGGKRCAGVGGGGGGCPTARGGASTSPRALRPRSAVAAMALLVFTSRGGAARRGGGGGRVDERQREREREKAEKVLRPQEVGSRSRFVTVARSAEVACGARVAFSSFPCHGLRAPEVYAIRNPLYPFTPTDGWGPRLQGPTSHRRGGAIRVVHAGEEANLQPTKRGWKLALAMSVRARGGVGGGAHRVRDRPDRPSMQHGTGPRTIGFSVWARRVSFDGVVSRRPALCSWTRSTLSPARQTVRDPTGQ